MCIRGFQCKSMSALQDDKKSAVAKDFGSGAAENKQYLVRMLAAYLDVGSTLVMEGSDLSVKADMKGLRLETLIELEKGSTASASSSTASTGMIFSYVALV